MPRSMAFFFNSTADAPTKTSSRISSSTSMTSYNPQRPLYPVLLQTPQPLPFWIFTLLDSSGVKPASSRVCAGTSITAMQSLQMRRTRRCAQMRWTDVATRNGSMPMFIRRVMVSGAPLVCSVESTRWPVSAALMAISAVSKSRISPTRMMLGSCRRNDRRAAAKFNPICSFICTWLTPPNWNSTGSSDRKIANFADENDVGILPQERSESGGKVQSDLLLHLHLVDAAQLEFDWIFRGHDVGVGLVQARDRRIERVGLARSRRSRNQHHAVRLQNGFFELHQRLGLEAKLGHVKTQVFFVEQPEHDFLAPQRRQRAHAEVELLLAAADVHLQHEAVFGRQTLSADVELGHDLQAGGNGVFQLQRRRHDGLQNAVNTEPDPEFLFVRLDVDVACAALHRIAQNHVDQLDDRSFVGRFLQFGQLHLLLFRLQFDVAVAHLRHRLHHGLKIFFLGRTVGLFNSRQDGAFRGDDRLDIEAGHELDIVHREDVGGIDHRDSERGAHAAQRKNLVALGGLERNQLDDCRINLEVGKVDGGNTILAGEEIGDVLVREEAKLHQGRPQATALLLLDLTRLFQLLWGNDLLFDEKVTQPLRHTQISYPRGWNDAAHCAGI